MKIVLPVLFLLDSIVNVSACALGKQPLRRFSKLLLMPLLCASYLLWAASPSWLVAAALLLGWLGDVFLIFKDDRRLLTVGMAAFGLGHVFYVISILVLRGLRPPLWAGVLVPLLLLCGAVLFFRRLRPSLTSDMKLPCLFYILLLSSLPVAAALSIFGGGPGGWFLLSGSLLFLVSDGTLSIETFVLEDSCKLDFVVMLTYISAQTLLALGFCG